MEKGGGKCPGGVAPADEDEKAALAGGGGKQSALHPDEDLLRPVPLPLLRAERVQR